MRKARGHGRGHCGRRRWQSRCEGRRGCGRCSCRRHGGRRRWRESRRSGRRLGSFETAYKSKAQSPAPNTICPFERQPAKPASVHCAVGSETRDEDDAKGKATNKTDHSGCRHVHTCMCLRMWLFQLECMPAGDGRVGARVGVAAVGALVDATVGDADGGRVGALVGATVASQQHTSPKPSPEYDMPV